MTPQRRLAWWHPPISSISALGLVGIPILLNLPPWAGWHPESPESLHWAEWHPKSPKYLLRVTRHPKSRKTHPSARRRPKSPAHPPCWVASQISQISPLSRVESRVLWQLRDSSARDSSGAVTDRGLESVSVWPRAELAVCPWIITT